MVFNPTVGNTGDILRQTFSGDTAMNMINENYHVYGMFYDRIDPSVASVLERPSDCPIQIWATSVHADFSVQVLSCLQLPGDATEPLSQVLFNFLTENLSLFQIMAEEDVQYQNESLIQNCK